MHWWHLCYNTGFVYAYCLFAKQKSIHIFLRTKCLIWSLSTWPSSLSLTLFLPGTNWYWVHLEAEVSDICFCKFCQFICMTVIYSLSLAHRLTYVHPSPYHAWAQCGLHCLWWMNNIQQICYDFLYLSFTISYRAYSCSSCCQLISLLCTIVMCFWGLLFRLFIIHTGSLLYFPSCEMQLLLGLFCS